MAADAGAGRVKRLWLSRGAGGSAGGAVLGASAWRSAWLRCSSAIPYSWLCITWRGLRLYVQGRAAWSSSVATQAA